MVQLSTITSKQHWLWVLRQLRKYGHMHRPWKKSGGQVKLKEDKKGDEMKLTIIHDLYSRNLNNDDREVLLDRIISKGRPSFRKLLL